MIRLGPAVAAATLAIAAVRPAAAQPLTADEIYDRARAVTAARRVPPYIAYTQDITFTRHGRSRTEHTRMIVRMADGKVNQARLPDSAADRVDTTPHSAERPPLYPTTTFGFVPRTRGEHAAAFEPPAPPEADSSSPAVIGRVSAVNRDYDVTLAGRATLDGADVYRLTLVPRYDPQRHILRELDVDTAGFNPRRIVIEVDRHAGPITTRPHATADYEPVEGTWMIRHATIDFVARFGPFAYGGSGEYRTRDITFPAAEPDSLFDPGARSGAPSALRETRAHVDAH